MKNSRKGFTLIELLLVISIIALLSSIILASLNSGREKGRIASILTFSTSVYHALGSNIQGHYNFDDSTRNDTSGNNNNPSSYSFTSFVDNDGFPGKALYLDIAYMLVPNNSSLKSTTGAITVEAWVKPLGTSQIYISRYGTPNPWFLSDQNANIFWQIYVDPSTVCSITVAKSQTSYVSGKWNHLLGTYDGAGNLQLYVDGKKVTGTASGTCNGPILEPASFGDLKFGGNGYIDNVRIYDDKFN